MSMRLPRWLRRFGKSSDGSSTVEFIVLLPGFIFLFLSSFELGMMMTRHVMLERGLDLAVRQVRLGTVDDVGHAGLVDTICDGVILMDNCATDLKLEMQRVTPNDGLNVRDTIDCVDREDPSIPPANFTPGSGNALMLLRACALFDPWFPTTGLAALSQRTSDGAYPLIASASYVIEPD